MRSVLSVLVLALAAPGMAADPALEGAWVEDCKPAREAGSQRNSAVVAGASLIFTISNFQDGACRAEGFDFVWNSTFSAGGEAAGVPGAKNIDFILDSITVTPKSESMAHYFNKTRFCELEGWTVGQAQKVTGLKCGGNRLGSSGYRAYNIYKVEAGRLHLHFESSTGSPDARPAALSKTFYHRP